jgi:hypothetical protein
MQALAYRSYSGRSNFMAERSKYPIAKVAAQFF